MTLKEMGKTLGVSPSTISKVLNGCQKNFTIPQELRERIMKHVDKCGYSPNPVFRSMRVNQNKQIACFFYSRSSLKTGNTVEVSVDSAITYLEELKYEVYYQFCTQARETWYPQPNWKVSGILIPDVTSATQLTALEAKKQIYVVLNGVCGPLGTAVQSDEVLNMRLAMQHFYELGHRRIAYLQPHQGDAQRERHYATTERLSSYEKFINECGLEPMIITAVNDNTKWADELFLRNPTAVIAGNEALGIKLFRIAYEQGIKVPQDMSLIVFNDVDYLSSMIPALSAVRIPALEMGTLAGQILAKRIKDPNCDISRTCRLPGELILRESTATLKH